MREPSKTDSADVIGMLHNSIKVLGIAPSEFWAMPFFMILELFNRERPVKNEPTRKEILAQKRYTKQKFGWI